MRTAFSIAVVLAALLYALVVQPMAGALTSRGVTPAYPSGFPGPR